MKNKSFRTSFFVGLCFTIMGLILMLLGLADLGLGLFFFLPLAVGLSSGLLPDLKQAIYGTLASLFIFSIFLIFTQIEGVICVLMALPIVLLAAWIGWAIGRSMRRKKAEDPSLKLTLSPFFIFIAVHLFELFNGNPMVPHSVSTTVELKGNPSEVYAAIIEVDTVDVETNFLQKIGLPIPRKCILTEEKVGGLRLCEFEDGRIVETITALKKNEYLKMDVTECKLSRKRDWLQFNEDIYNISSTGDNLSEITRTTTYSSNLKPRIYWEVMEALTISSEHEFVFRNLKKDVEN